MTRYGMAIDMNHCTGCQTCVVSCQLNNALRPGVARISVDTLEWGRWPEGDRACLPHGCIQCDEPRCVKVCPTGASHRREDGIVVVQHELCIGCGVCITACAYGGRSISTAGFNFKAAEPAPYEAEGMQPVGVADKCTFCVERVDQGEMPVCVRDCVASVRVFGDLDDPNSDVSAFIDEHACVGIPGSAVYYHQGERDFDLEATITTNYFTSTKDEQARHKEEAPAVNPVVIGTAGAVTAAVAVGLGVSARRTRAKRNGA